MEPLRLGLERAARAERLAAEAAAALNEAAPEFLTRFPLAPYVAELEHDGRPHRFFEFTPRALELTAEIHAAYDKPIVEIFNRLMLARLLADVEQRNAHTIIPSVQPFVLEDFDRILKGLEKPRPNYYLRDNHLFRRDLAIARLKVFPNGFELYDIGIRIARGEALKGGVSGLWRFVKAFQLQLLKPLGPFCEPHWDRRYVKYFSPIEYERCSVRVADMMAANPEIQGIAVPSWWYDPQLGQVSPEMAFLRAVPESGGARFMLLKGYNPYLLTDSLAHSPVRKAAYEAGTYKPQSIMMVWPRREMIAWANRERARIFADAQK
jgi:hypothetical protein